MPRKTIEEISQLKAGMQAEDSVVFNPPGWYTYEREDGTQDRILAMQHPKFGTAQADAFVHVGYVYDGPATAAEMAPIPMVQDSNVHSNYVPPVDTVPRAEFDALKARLDSLETAKEAVPVAKPMTQWNKEMLLTKLGELGVEAPAEATNKQLLELIKDHE